MDAEAFFAHGVEPLALLLVARQAARDHVWPARPRRRQIALPMPPMPPVTKAMRETTGCESSRQASGR
jgi:hypothetical protein